MSLKTEIGLRKKTGGRLDQRDEGLRDGDMSTITDLTTNLTINIV